MLREHDVAGSIPAHPTNLLQYLDLPLLVDEQRNGRCNRLDLGIVRDDVDWTRNDVTVFLEWTEPLPGLTERGR